MNVWVNFMGAAMPLASFITLVVPDKAGEMTLEPF
jgi:hypothetical protein